MARSRTPIRCAIGKLIVELDREYMRAIEYDQPREWIEAAHEKAHDLLSCQTGSDIQRRIGAMTATRYFGALQSASYPGIAAKLSVIDSILKCEDTCITHKEDGV